MLISIFHCIYLFYLFPYLFKMGIESTYFQFIFHMTIQNDGYREYKEIVNCE